MENRLIDLKTQLRTQVNPPRRVALVYSLAAAAVLFLLYLGASSLVERQLLQDEHVRMEAQVSSYGNALVEAVSERLTLVSGLRAFVQAELSHREEIKQDEFDAFAGGLEASKDGVRNIALGPGGIMQFVFPAVDNQSVIGYEPASDPRPEVRQEVQRAIKSHQIVLSQPYELIQGGLGIIARQAVFIDGEYWGLANVVADVPPILEDAGLMAVPQDMLLALKDQSGHVFFGDDSVFASDPVSFSVPLPEGEWVLAGVPDAGWDAAIRRSLWVFRTTGLLVVLLGSVVVYLFANRQNRLVHLVQQRTSQLRRSNEGLLQELKLRQETERSLAESHQTLLLVMDSIHADVYVADMQTYEILYMNGHMRDSFGDKLVGKICYQVFRGEESICSHCTNPILLDAQGEPTGIHVWEGRNPLTDRWYINADQAIRWVDGRLVRIQIATEITRLKEAENALRDREAKLELAVTGSQGGQWMYELDPASDSLTLPDEVFISKRAKGFLGFTETELASSLAAWEERILPEDVAILRQKSQDCLAGHTPEFEAEYRMRHKDGSIRWIYSRGQIQRNEDGRPIRFAGIDWDITARKKAEQSLKAYSELLEERVDLRSRQLKQAQEQLVRQEKLAVLGQFAGSVGHELRNPLGVIKNAADFLEIALSSPEEEVKEAIQILQLEVINSERIIRSLLDFARTRQPVLQEADLNGIVVKALASLPMPNNIEVTTALAEDGPLVLADISQIQQVFINLIQNAVQAMPDGGKLTVQVEKDDDGGTAVTISDTGQGISPEHKARLFEPLFTTKARGIGLGLALVKNLVEGHRGTIEVESEMGRGSCFKVHLSAVDLRPHETNAGAKGV